MKVIDDKVWELPARNGDVAGVAIHTCVALSIIAASLDRIASGEKPTDEAIAEIRKAAETLSQRFESLAGWTDE